MSVKVSESKDLTKSEVRKSYDDATALVTGGAGFIGSNLVGQLLNLNVNQITVLDDLSSACEWNLPRDRRIRFIHGSILDDEKLTTAFESRPRFVFHLAAHFANQNSVDHPETDLAVNGLGTLKMLRLARTADTARFVFASSGCSVYGSEAPLPLKEDFVSIRLDTPYQITKLLGELYCNYFSDQYGMKVSVPRFFNVYGPGEVPGNYRNVIPNFLFWAITKNPLPITGTGDETRDFTFVEDVVDGILRCGHFDEAIGQAMNLASGVETRIIDLAKSINRLTGNEKGIVMRPKRTWDKSTRRRASIDKASRLIGYTPSTKIEAGLKSTLSWFRKQWTMIQRDARF